MEDMSSAQPPASAESKPRLTIVYDPLKSKPVHGEVGGAEE